MKRFILLIFSVIVIQITSGLPVSTKEEKEVHHEEKTEQDVADSLEYERYLKEVINVLETDNEFRKKLDNATDVDIRSGKIAYELEHVNHNVRSKLDEIKRRELDRLRSLATKQFELSNDIDRDQMKIWDPRHLDHGNPHTFEIEDLKKLILKTSEDLAEADKKRRDEFKEYELQKEFEKREKMREMDEEHRKKYEDELKQQQQKHNRHEKVHHPGNKAQLEEVWEKQDHMDASDFDPKTFFMMHDLDGNNFWDQTEVKALFVKELDKVYQSGLPEDDMRERVEEMERMREHVFHEADTNRDNLISLDEFIAQTKREEFNRDPNWDTVDNQPQFTHEEYLEFERRRREEVDRLIAQGMLPPHPNMPNGYYPNQGYPAHPNAIPQGQQYQHHQQQQQQQPGQYQYQHQQQPYYPAQGQPQLNQHAQNPNIQYQQHPNAVPNNQPYMNQNQNQNYGNVQYQNQGSPQNAPNSNAQPVNNNYQGQVNPQQANPNHISDQYRQPVVPQSGQPNQAYPQGGQNQQQAHQQAQQQQQQQAPQPVQNQQAQNVQPNIQSGKVNGKQEQVKQPVPASGNLNAINANDKH